MKNFVIKRWSDLLLGILFVVSGFVKAVDPVGFSYKIGEYLKMFQLSDWEMFSIPLSVLLCAAEMILGLMLLLRLWRRMTAVVVSLFILGFTILTYLIYTDPYGGIDECGCFGEALHLSNGATFAKNLYLLIVAGFHLWRVFRQDKNSFNCRQIGLTAGVLTVAFFIPLYSYLFLPPFDFLPYNVGTRIEAKNAINLYNSDFDDVTTQLFPVSKPTYMIGVRENIPQKANRKIAALYEAYKNRTVNLFVATPDSDLTISDYNDIPIYHIDNVLLKSILRSFVGIVAFADNNRIIGKWNLLYTPCRFDNEYGRELIGEQLKRGTFFGVLLLMVVLLIYGHRKIKM